MSEEDDRWALEHLKDVDERSQAFGVGTFRMAAEDGLVHRVVWSRVTGSWARICDHMGVKRKVLNAKETPPDPGAVTCFACLGKGA
jgi:hypothetical protein